MNAKLTDDVREALETAARDVDVPPADQAAFRALVGPTRRRRTARRLTWGVVAVGTATACVLGVTVVRGSLSDDPDLAPAGGAEYVVEQAPTPDAVLVGDSELVTVGVGGTSTYPGSFGTPKDAYRTPQGVLVLGDDGRLTALDQQGDTFVETELEGEFDAFQVSADGTVLAGFPVGGTSMSQVDIEQGVQIEAPLSADRRLVATQGDEVVAAHGSTLQHTYVVEGRGNVATETATFEGVDAGLYGVNGSWRGDLLALPRKDEARTDVYRVGDGTADAVSSVPLAAGVLSPAGDNVVGFTADALDQPLGVGTADAVEIWSADGERSDALRELPALVTEVGWLDNDTVAVVGGDGEGQWPTALDLYTCELEDLTCQRVAEDPTGSSDELPILASGSELPSLVGR
jgi:hypothetical protein